jgi:hypothetical protein
MRTRDISMNCRLTSAFPVFVTIDEARTTMVAGLLAAIYGALLASATRSRLGHGPKYFWPQALNVLQRDADGQIVTLVA